MSTYDITALSTPLEFDTTNANGKSVVAIPSSDRVLMAWVQSSTLIYVQAFDVNTTTGAVTAIGTPLDIETGTTSSTTTGISLVMIDSSNAFVAWPGVSADGFSQLLSIDGSGNVTTNGSSYEFDIANCEHPSSILWDSTHILIAWSSTGQDGFAVIVSVDTSTGTLANVGTAFEFDTSLARGINITKLTSTKALITYAATGLGNDAAAVVLDINSSTYDVTAAGSKFVYQSDSTTGNTCNVAAFVEDLSSTIKVVALTRSSDALSTHLMYAYSLIIDTTTWGITTQNSSQFAVAGSSSVEFNAAIRKLDSNNLLIFYTGADNDGFSAIISYETSTGIVSVYNTLEFDTDNAIYFSQNIPVVDTDKYLMAWAGTANDGFIQSFQVSQQAGAVNNQLIMHHMQISGGIM
jgi:hypothetical protein